MRNVARVCLEIGYPTLASVPHTIINGYKNVLAVTVETNYSFPLADKVHTQKLDFYTCAIDRRNLQFNKRCKLMYDFACPQVKAYLADPSAFAAAAPAAAAAETAAAPAVAKEEAKEESEESDDDMGFGLFD